MTKTQSRVLTVVLIGVVTLLSVHLIDEWLGGARVDMTAENIYSLTPGSVAILDKMREEGVKPLDVRLYFSETTGKTLPKFVKDFITYERYIRTLLAQYESASRGKIRFETIDPITDSDEADEAAADGLEGKLINQNGDLFYFGIAFETQTGSKEAIEFLWPNEQENIEYEISKKIYKLLWQNRQRVGVLSSLEVMGGAQDPFMAQMLAAQGRTPAQKWIAMQLLEELYEVSAIDSTTDEISRDDYDIIVVIHPKDLPEKTQFAIDQWVAGGGNAMIFIDPYTIADQAPQNPQQPWAALQYKPASNLDQLLTAWGLRRPEDRFAVDFDLAVRRPTQQFGPAEAVIYDLQIDSESEGVLADASPILQGMQDLRFLLSGSLERLDVAADETEAGEAGEEGGDAGLDYEALITTTSAGSVVTIMPGFGGGDGLAYTDLNNAAKVRDEFVPGEEPVVLAYAIRGTFPTAFPQGVDYPDKEAQRPPNLPPGIEVPPPDDAVILHKDPLPAEERQEAAVIVVADVDFIGDQVAFARNPFGLVQATNDNHKVFLNAVDYLLGSEELMAVRAKKSLHRPFLLFDEIEAEAEKETLERERQIRDEIASFQAELQTKQSEITQRNASLFEKKVQDEVDALNERILEGNRELRDIRKSRREALESEESSVRFAVIGWMPTLILILGIFRAVRRRSGKGA